MEIGHSYDTIFAKKHKSAKWKQADTLKSNLQTRTQTRVQPSAQTHTHTSTRQIATCNQVPVSCVKNRAKLPISKDSIVSELVIGQEKVNHVVDMWSWSICGRGRGRYMFGKPLAG